MQPATPPPPPGRALVTGVSGFAGSFLAEALLARGDAVVGLSRNLRWPAGCEHLAERVELLACDLCDPAALDQALRRAAPTHVYHLAGYAATGRSFQEPDAAWDGNLTATRRLYEAVTRWGGRPRILFVGSGLVYGETGGAGDPAAEDAPLRPGSPYAASKAAADLVSYQFARAGLDVVRARPFNHVGPRQSAQFAVANFARQVVAIERGRAAPELATGDLRPERDLTDVRDVASAYLLLMRHGRAGEAYNVGTGTSHSMRSVLERLLALAGRSPRYLGPDGTGPAAPEEVVVRAREDLLRPGDQMVMRIDANKLRRETGWEPRYPIEQTLADTLEYWRRHG